MATIDGGHLVTRALRNEGVDLIFSLSGGHIEPIYRGCQDDVLRIVDTRHEQAAAHMAEGWAKVTRRPGVAVVTAGPGLTDAITGVCNANEAGVPLVLISARALLRETGMGTLQDIDQIGLLRPITKWAQTCYETRRIPEYIRAAFRHAMSGRPGPVFLEIPRDALEAQIDDAAVRLPEPRPEPRAAGDPAAVDAALRLLADAQRPIVLAGSAIWWSDAGEELRQLVEFLQLPLTLVENARGAVAEDHPCCFGPTRVGTREADVVLAIGLDLNFTLTYGGPPLFGTGARWIQVDADARQIGRTRDVDVAIVGDARVVLRQMLDQTAARAARRTGSAWLAGLRQHATARWQRMVELMGSERVPIHPLRLAAEIARFAERDATLVVDGGDIAIWAGMVLRVYRPGSYLEPGPMGTLGIGQPYAIAAKLARPERQVLLVSGDGAFGFNGLEFDTAVRHDVPIVCVVANDGAWSMIKHSQEAKYGPAGVVATELRLTRYDQVVEALGGYGEHVTRPDEIRPALERACASGRPACINVLTDPTVVVGRRPGL